MSELSTNPPAVNSAPAENGPRTLSERVKSLRLDNRHPEPGPRFRWLPWVLCVLLAGSTAFFALGSTGVMPFIQDDKEKKQADTAKDASNSTRPNDQAGPGELVLHAKGYVVPVHLIQVSPKVGGMVTALNFKEEDRVQEGDVLAQIEDVEFKADRDRIKGLLDAAEQRYLELKRGWRKEEIEQAKAELDEAEAQREQLYLNWKRYKDLSTGRALAASEYEQALSLYQAIERRVERLKLAHKLMQDGPREEKILAARAEVDQMKADLTKAEWKFGNCTVRAPASGTILKKTAEKGNMVNPQAFSNGLAASLCEMADLTDLEVDLAIAERDIGRLFKDQRCEIKTEAYPDKVWKGYVSRIMPQADRGKGAVPVRVKIEGITRADEGQFLRPDMTATVTFYNERAKR